MQEHDEGDRARPQVDIRGPQGIGCLQRMTALDAASTLGARPNLDIKCPNDWLHARQIFLILGRRVRRVHRSATVWTRRRHGRRMTLIDVSGRTPPGAPAIGRARAATRPAVSTL
jgi:hypothetical protein